MTTETTNSYETRLWQRDSTLPFQTMDDEVIVVDPATREVHLLNATAARIWILLAKAQSLPTLVAALEGEFEGSGPELREDVQKFLDELVDKRLCAPESPAPGAERPSEP